MSKSSPDFLWGVASSAFQYEGHVQNDMTDWEAAGGFKQNGHDPSYGKANNHWEMWEHDLSRLRELGVNAYRFSMEWSRLYPERGRVDESALASYDRLVDQLLEQRIEPMLTLHHFTHPRWFHESTPWHDASALESFAEFVDLVVRRFGSRIRWYATLNEPMAWAVAAYGDGRFPPGHRDLPQMMQVIRRLLLAHSDACRQIRAHRKDAVIGIAHSCVEFAPSRSWHPLDRGLSQRIDYFFNRMFPDAVTTGRLQVHFPGMLDFDESVAGIEPVDFWGVNYYYRLHVRFRFNRKRPFDLHAENRSGLGLTDMGWEIYPPGLETAVRRMASYGKPVVITENGIATENEDLRQSFIEEHLAIVKRLRGSDLNVGGYFYWSFLDNYEWLVGTKARFGLYNVLYDNGFDRTLRPAGLYYSGFIAADGRTSTP